MNKMLWKQQSTVVTMFVTTAMACHFRKRNSKKQQSTGGNWWPAIASDMGVLGKLLVVEAVMTFDCASTASSNSDATAKSSNELVVMSKSKWHWGNGNRVMVLWPIGSNCGEQLLLCSNWAIITTANQQNKIQIKLATIKWGWQQEHGQAA